MGKKCKKCTKFNGEFCTIVHWRSIDELNTHGKCGFFEKPKYKKSFLIQLFGKNIDK